MRILTTVAAKNSTLLTNPLDPSLQDQYYSKNYRRFLEHRHKKIDKHNVSCVGWTHVQRIIEVLEMSVRDLIYKIVPAKVVVRELKTSQGKVLTKDSEYVLLEKKQYVTVGKKQQVEYTFALDIKEDSPKPESDQQQETKPQRNPLFLNLENFSLFKLRSTMFLIDFPMNFLIRMMDIWGKIIPQTMSSQEYTKEEQGMVNTVKQTIKEFRLNLVDYFTHLSDYIVSVRAEQPPMHNYTLIKESPLYTKLRAAFK